MLQSAGELRVLASIWPRIPRNELMLQALEHLLLRILAPYVVPRLKTSEGPV